MDRRQAKRNRASRANFVKVENRTSDFISIDLLSSESTGPPLVLPPRSTTEVDEELFDQYDYKDMEKEGNIAVTTPGDTIVNWIVKNETARRIGIAPLRGKKRKFIIPPFGSRTVSPSVLGQYKHQEWEDQNLIIVTPVPKKTEKSEYDDILIQGTGCFLFLVGFLYSIITLIIAVRSPSATNWRVFGIGTGVWLLTLLIILLTRKEEGWERIKRWLARVWQWLKNSPNVLWILLAGLGMPALIIYYFGGGKELLERTQVPDVALLGRSMQLAFIAVASTLPALFYFLFGRQQLEKTRESFFREVMMLDPNIQARSEARTKYNPLLDEIYGSGGTQSLLGFGLPILISTMLTTLGWTLTLLPIGTIDTLSDSSLLALFAPHPVAINFGFLGAYFFTLNMVFRRYVRSDLTPKTYAYTSVRFLVTIILVWAVSSLPRFLGIEAGADSSGLLLLAFVIGIFPETGTALIQDFNRKVFGPIIPSLQEEHPLTNLEGINLYDRARLLEEGIENIENLAHHNLVELVARTRIPTPRLVDLFDQAILYLHLGLDANKLKEIRQHLREYGIRTATDLQQVQRGKLLNLLKKSLPGTDRADQGQEGKAVVPQDTVDRLEVILRALEDDEWMEYLNHWRKSTTRSEEIATLDEFYAPA
jgi:hypothetical protein